MRTDLKLLIITLFLAIIFCLTCRLTRATTYTENFSDNSIQQNNNENTVKEQYDVLVEDYEIVCINGYSYIRNKGNGNLTQMFEEGFANVVFSSKRGSTKITLPTRCR